MRTVIGAWMLVGCTGPEQSFTTLYPAMAVSPDSLPFGQVSPVYPVTLPVYVSNAGRATLEVSITLEGDAPYTVDLPQPIELQIPPEGQEVIDITFAPETFLSYTGALRIESNDEENPLAEVKITGQGADLPLPDIAILPARTVEVVDVVVGSEAAMSFEIHNLGAAPLSLGDLRIDDDPEFAEVVFPSGGTIQPQDFALVYAAYRPADDEGDDAWVVIPSNDPNEPETRVLLLGNGGSPDFEYPTALIDCPSQVLLAGPEYTTISGAGSTDPAGGILSFRWTVLGRPPSADQSVALDPSTLPTIDLYTDVAGVWTVQLVVTNEIGTNSLPAVCQFEAIPEDNFHFELSWDSPAADLDLHLLQAGFELFDQPEDCFYCNRNPSWGVAGGDDDPRLDLDDKGGFGPENINILEPPDGDYEIWVHDFNDHGDGPSVATVDVWLDGASLGTFSRVMLDKEVWRVGTVSWPYATFAADLGPNLPQPIDGGFCEQ